MRESRRRGPDNARGDVMRRFCARCEGGEAAGVCACDLCVCVCVGYIEGIGWLIT